MRIGIDCVHFRRYNPYEYQKIVDNKYKGESKWDVRVKKVEASRTCSIKGKQTCP